MRPTSTLQQSDEWPWDIPRGSAWAAMRPGSLSIWLDRDMVWLAQRGGANGRPPVFSDAALQFCLMVKVLFGAPLRQTTGMVVSIFPMAGLDRPWPDFSTLSRRQKRITVLISNRRVPGSSGPWCRLRTLTSRAAIYGCFGETSEIAGAEHICKARAMTEAVGERWHAMWKAYQDDVIFAHQTDDLSESQPTKGNIEGGLTTIEEKALGNLEKIGRTSRYVDILGPAEAPASGKGLYFMDSSSAAAECVTLMAAGGYVVHTFPTGRGSPAFRRHSLSENILRGGPEGCKNPPRLPVQLVV